MRLPVPGPRDVLSALERGSEQVEALLGAVPRALALLDQAEVLIERRLGDGRPRRRSRRRCDRGGRPRGRGGGRRRPVEVRGDGVGGRSSDAAGAARSTAGRSNRRWVASSTAAEQIDRVGTVVDGAAVQADRAGGLLDALEPPLTKLQPTLQTLADTTHPDEVAALVRLVDHLPALTDQVERDVLPVLTTLGSVAPDLHELLNVSARAQRDPRQDPGHRPAEEARRGGRRHRDAAVTPQRNPSTP